MKNEVGKVIKNNITLVEYEKPVIDHSNKFFIQIGIVGIHCTEKELKDLYSVLNYYMHIEDFSECKIKVGDENVSIS